MRKRGAFVGEPAESKESQHSLYRQESSSYKVAIEEHRSNLRLRSDRINDS